MDKLFNETCYINDIKIIGSIIFPILFLLLTIGTGVITRNELKHFYTAFMDVGKLGDKELDDLTTKSFNTLTSVSCFSRLQKFVGRKN